MRFWKAILCLGAIVSSVVVGNAEAQNGTSVVQWPLHNDGLNTVVEWDHYSFLINGKRLFIFGGEFHYWRFPVPELWEDLLLKIKAAGFNAFSIYSNWAYHAPSPTVLDFTNGSRNFTTIFTLAQKIGLYVLYRPGPYVNAEANAGGLPLWLTTGAYGALRNNDTRYTEAWMPYMIEISKIVAPHLITNGGNVIAFQIENELGNQWIGDPADKIPDLEISQYMQQLEDVSRANGIDIPLSFNNPNMVADSWSMDFAPGAEGDVDVVGLDSYPSCWSCNLAECTTTNGPYVPFEVVPYYSYFADISPTQPNFMPEFQGGSYNPWGGPAGGCPENSDDTWANIFYRHNVAERVTALNLYMLYGGTSWGFLPAPVVATSYDYSAPISENRAIGAKYYETKLLALFLRAATDLTKTDRLGNDTSYSTNSNIFTSELRNPDTDAAFYITIHDNSTSASVESFRLHVNTSAGLLTIPKYAPEIVLNGHQSKIIVTDFSFGPNMILYSTAEVLATAIIDNIPVIALWVPTGESGEIAFKDFKSGEVTSCVGGSGISFKQENRLLVLSFTQGAGNTIVELDGGRTKVLLLDRTAAYKFWAPSLVADPFAPTDETVFVQGPYLVRSASVEGSTLALTGDINEATTITAFASHKINTLKWNGTPVRTTKSPGGALTAFLTLPISNFTLPAFTNWLSHDALPEKAPTYQPTSPTWKLANDTTTPNPTKPLSLPVLYTDQYGFHTGSTLYHAHLNGAPTALTIGAQGGTAFGFSAYLNGVHIGSYPGNNTLEVYNATFVIPASALASNSTGSSLLVVMDNTGHDERAAALLPRGILYAFASGGALSDWRIAGTAGGEENLDPIRGPLSEGGLTPERLGWQLPGFDASAWSSLSPSTGTTDPGIQFYVTTAELHIPSGLDVSISFTLGVPSGGTKKVRSMLWVNGYMYGLFNPWVGNQVVFPVPPGVLDLDGVNTVAVSVWNQDEDGGVAGVDVSWDVEYVHETGYDFGFDASALRPTWDASRAIYT